MENALVIRELCKSYRDFSLQKVSFSLPRGCVMGFIGENGAGKTTTIKALLGLNNPESGSLRVLGLDAKKDGRAIRERVGVVLEDGQFPPFFTAKIVNQFMGKAYQNWDSALYLQYMQRFSIGMDKKVKDYSKGMRMKLSIACALSHRAELLLLDEPTSGLDPVVRDEVLDLFYEFMQQEDRSILLSSHITSDLDKIADYITFIHQGRILLSERRDELLESCGVLKCTAEQLKSLAPEAVRATRRGAFGAEVLVRRALVPNAWPVERVNIEQIMLFYTRGETGV